MLSQHVPQHLIFFTDYARGQGWRKSEVCRQELRKISSQIVWISALNANIFSQHTPTACRRLIEHMNILEYILYTLLVSARIIELDGPQVVGNGVVVKSCSTIPKLAMELIISSSTNAISTLSKFSMSDMSVGSVSSNS